LNLSMYREDSKNTTASFLLRIRIGDGLAWRKYGDSSSGLFVFLGVYG